MVEPAHWLIGRDEPVRRRLDVRTIVERAHGLVHEGGFVALSMRTLAGALDTSTSALYRHVPSKQWLLIAIVDHVLEDVDTSAGADRRRSARTRLEAISDSYREVLSAHPHLHEILTSYVTLTPNSIRIADAALTCLRDLGIRDEDVVDAYNAWCGYVIGFSILETKPPEHAPERSLEVAMRAALDRTDANLYPVVTELKAELANRAYGLRWQPSSLGNGRASFRWGLRALLDGYESRGRRSRGARSVSR